jgi:hypothetical protein
LSFENFNLYPPFETSEFVIGGENIFVVNEKDFEAFETFCVDKTVPVN